MNQIIDELRQNWPMYLLLGAMIITALGGIAMQAKHQKNLN